MNAIHAPPYGVFRDTPWRLMHYYEKKREERGTVSREKTKDFRHPFETKLPEGCVAEMIRGLAYADVTVGVASATFPQQLRNMR